MKKLIIETLTKLFKVYRKQTETERAFATMHNMDKMQMFIQQEKLEPLCYSFPQDIVQKYRINSDVEVWEVIIRFRDAKQLLKDIGESGVLIEDGYQSGIDLQTRVKTFINE